MFPLLPKLSKPGLFVTATDTGVGKTVVTCALAAALRKQQLSSKIGVCKPMASGCRKEREGLVAEDAEALAHFSDCRQPLEIINPIRYLPPVAPAVAAEITRQPIDWDALGRSLQVLDGWCDYLLIEGVGGLLVPIDPLFPKRTVLDLIMALGYPVLVVARAGLGTLNHTTMTVRLLEQAGCRVAGLAINGYLPDSSSCGDPVLDISITTNRVWLTRMTGVPILATVPACPGEQVVPHRGQLPPAVLEALLTTYWPEVLVPPEPQG